MSKLPLILFIPLVVFMVAVTVAVIIVLLILSTWIGIHIIKLLAEILL